MSLPFSFSVERSPGALVLLLYGEFDLAGIGAVENTLDAIPPGAREVVFDLRGVTFLDAAALGTIMRADERARASGRALIVVRPRGYANRVFTLTRAGRHLRLVDAYEPAAGGESAPTAA